MLWGVWFLTGVIFFSVANEFQAYYLVMLAPAIAALAGGGALELWEDYRSGPRRRWLLRAAPIILTTGRPVMALGGYSGTDPILTIDKLARLVASGQVGQFLLGDRGQPDLDTWIIQRCWILRPTDLGTLYVCVLDG